MKRMPYLQPLNIDGVTGFKARFTEPTTVKSVLLERWEKDTEEMVKDTKDIHYNVIMERWEFPNGTVALCESDAERLYRSYLNSAAEVETGRCTTCDNNGKPICSSCIMTGHGNDIDFYRAATEPKGEATT